jgi:hypothetical protein
MGFKDAVRNSILWGPICSLRAARFERSYQRRRDQYEQWLSRQGVRYEEAAVIERVRDRMRARGYSAQARPWGEMRILSMIGDFSWHPMLLLCLGEIGQVVNCDYAAFGLDRASSPIQAMENRHRFSRHVLDTLREQSRDKPFDWVFAYVNGGHIEKDLPQRIHDEFGLPTVNMCLDDKNSWTTRLLGGQDCGQKDLAGAFDLSWTSASVACGWYLAEGGRPIYLPEGCDPIEYASGGKEYDIPLSFLGASYGCRPLVVRHLRRRGLPIQIYGRSWGARGRFADSPSDIFARSQINLGIGGISFSESLTNVKGRDFDVACTGGGAYLTTFNPDLAKAFAVGEEILCYANREEAVEMAYDYLRRPEDCRAMALRARRRCPREHRWSQRFWRICEILGVARGIAPNPEE